MNSNTKHVFFIQSDFHYVFCKNLIKWKGLKQSECFFICRRGMTVEDGDQRCYLYDDEKGDFFPRFKYYIKHKKEIKSFYKGWHIIAYFPFMCYYQRFSFFDEYIYFEEGFSAYSKQLNGRTLGGTVLDLLHLMVVMFLTPFADRNVKGYLMGYNFSRFSPAKKTQILSISPTAYQYRNHPLLIKSNLVIHKDLDINEVYPVPQGSLFLVLDRFNKFGRVFSIDKYKTVLHTFFKYCQNRQVSDIWTKYHPADYNNPESKSLFYEIYKDYNLNVHFFDGRLEYLAIQNKNITFVGLHSTILYYAPLLGDSNSSLSYSEYLMEIDPFYIGFLNELGGADYFFNLFSKHVKQIKPK